MEKNNYGRVVYLGGDWSREREAKAQQKGRSGSEKKKGVSYGNHVVKAVWGYLPGSPMPDHCSLNQDNA